MKTRAKKTREVSLVSGSAADRQARMRAYLVQSKPQFDEAVASARTLGSVATGVLAGRVIRGSTR